MAESGPSAARYRWFTSRRYRVVDESMVPTLLPGDRVLVDRAAFRRRPPTPGSLVALEDPERPGRWLVKRVAAVGPTDAAVPVPGAGEAISVPVPPGHVYVLSEAPGVGRDSRRFGPVPFERVRGAVWYRIGPSDRRGPLA